MDILQQSEKKIIKSKRLINYLLACVCACVQDDGHGRTPGSNDDERRTPGSNRSRKRRRSPPRRRSSAVKDEGSTTEDEEEAKYAISRRQRKRCSPMVSDIRERCRRKWFSRIDARYLATENAYKLYADTPRGETIQLNKFNKLCRPVIDEVLTEPTEESVNQLLKEMKLMTKKRRDHHRKCWREDKRHARLIYGGRLPNEDSDSSDSAYERKKSPPRSPRQQSPRKVRRRSYVGGHKVLCRRSYVGGHKVLCRRSQGPM